MKSLVKPISLLLLVMSSSVFASTNHSAQSAQHTSAAAEHGLASGSDAVAISAVATSAIVLAPAVGLSVTGAASERSIQEIINNDDTNQWAPLEISNEVFTAGVSPEQALNQQ